MSLDKERLLEAITSAQSAYIAQADQASIFDGLLVSLLALTGSEYGYIGEVLHDGEGAPYLRTHAISNISWDETTRAFYEKNAPTGLVFRNLKTLFGHVIAHGEVVIANDPANDPRAGGLPPGHPALRAYLGLPFFAGGELVGSAGISNRVGGYDDDVVRYLEPFVATSSNLILAHRAKHTQARNERLKREFVAIVSHELRTPMTSLRGSLGLLAGLHKESLPADAQHLLDVASRGCDRMVRLLDDLLDVEKLQQSNVQLRLGECDLSGLVARCFGELDVSAARRNVSLRADCPEGLVVVADSDRLLQILVNLVSNGIKFSPEGAAVEVAVRDQGDAIRIEVADHGKGIPTEEQSAIFDKFHQVSDSSTRTTDGVGLGLYIVRQLVEKHGGTIRVRSVEGEGACFVVTLPKSWTGAAAHGSKS